MRTLEPVAPLPGRASEALRRPSARTPGDLLVTVRHEPGSWTVCGPDLETLVFPSGATAERAARRLAACLASLGDDVRVEIHDNRDALGEHIRVFADGPAVDAGAARTLHV